MVVAPGYGLRNITSLTGWARAGSHWETRRSYSRFGGLFGGPDLVSVTLLVDDEQAGGASGVAEHESAGRDDEDARSSRPWSPSAACWQGSAEDVAGRARSGRGSRGEQLGQRGTTGREGRGAGDVHTPTIGLLERAWSVAAGGGRFGGLVAGQRVLGRGPRCRGGLLARIPLLVCCVRHLRLVLAHASLDGATGPQEILRRSSA